MDGLIYKTYWKNIKLDIFNDYLLWMSIIIFIYFYYNKKYFFIFMPKKFGINSKA